ncbi:sensor histidine kinase [Xylanimonas oleitrophica]|uniref:histidine kinase n=1 Tax=Xylanimonas oleitrophica TaxID=2607479 RepID=A0A2W5X073_9MICO|nr:HAMP domain-containing sensor histidine kinase [Xylanimonas oleitrophica]PZR54096.1 sensor histidine kinase [Xylanimonas oleitrophica]
MTDDRSPAPPGPVGRVVSRTVAWLHTVPLRARLVTIIALLLAIGLGVTALTTQTIVSRYLVKQVDEQLDRTASSARALNLAIGGSGSGPSDYYVLLRDASGGSQRLTWDPTVRLYGEPSVPPMTQDEVDERQGVPFTVGSNGGSHPTQWRVVAVNVAVEPRQTPAVAFVALPLTRVHEASNLLAVTLSATGIGIIFLGAGVAWLLVHRSLRPLRQIETTAAAIAAGDLARRVPAAPPSTEVGSLATSLNAMLAQIEQAFAARAESEQRMRRFVSDASHELRTPLATIRGYGELYRMGALDDDAKVADTMGRIEDAARRMGALVNDLLDLARMDEGRPLRHDPVELVRLADDAVQDLRALDPSRTVTVVPLAPPPGPDGAGAPCAGTPASLVVTGDGDRLRQVLTNLVGNVARHTPAGTPAEVALGQVLDPLAGPTAVVEVRDHGPGVTPEQAQRMFERFYRADSSRNRGSGGSGLGLAIVAAIVGAHGGAVDTRTTPGGGLTVRVRLPLAPQGVEASDAPGPEHGYDGPSSSPPRPVP